MQNKNKVIAGVAATVVGLSASGLAFIAGWEGKENKPYQDIVGVWTVCYGSTGPHVRSGGVRTDAECQTMLREDAVRFEAAVARCSAPAVLNQNQYDAVVSLAFNIGTQGYCNSTLSRKLRAGDYAGASAEFPKWSYAGGRQVRGLLNRRTAEQALFNTPVATRPSDPPPPVTIYREGQGVGLVAR